MLSYLKKELNELSNPKKAEIYSRFFKTGKGQYGEGDIFIGLTVPEQRTIAKKYSELSMSDLQKLVSSKIHEHRITALMILVSKYKKTKDKKLVDFYLKNLKYVNNWDLVDMSSENILGNYLKDKNRNILYNLAKSENLWERRIAIISTFAFIRENDFQDTLDISALLLKDKHDLIHKAVGWMLREVGKRNQKTEEDFLKKHHKIMPRTMLRYSIEKFSEDKRKYYMAK